MNASRRRSYLDALGIEPWLPRNAPSPELSTPMTATTSTMGYADVPSSALSAREHESASSAFAASKRSSNSMSHPAIEMAKVKLPAAPVPAREVPTDWAGLQSAVGGCTECKLCRTRNNTVFGVGLQVASLLVVGEGPGADEDAQGLPFVGRAGKLLDEMLKAIGRSRHESAAEKSVYIANVVKCRPPANRDPENDEVEACRPYLDQQIRLIQPKLIVALGRIAAQRLLSTDEPLSKLRGSTFHYGPERTPVIITYHPAYLLRSPGEKAKSWSDLKRVHQFLHG
jgi:DNA polymerase